MDCECCACEPVLPVSSTQGIEILVFSADSSFVTVRDGGAGE